MQTLPDGTTRKQIKPMHECESKEDILRAFTTALGEARDASELENHEIERNWKYYWGQHYLRRVGTRWVADRTLNQGSLRIQRDIIQLAIDALRPILIQSQPHLMCLASYPNEMAEIEMSGNRIYTVDGLFNSEVAGFVTTAIEKDRERRYDTILLAELLLEVLVAGQAYRTLLPVHRPGYGTVLYPKLYPASRVLKDPMGTNLADFSDFLYVIFEDQLSANEIKQVYGVDEREYTKRMDVSKSSMAETESSAAFRGVSEFRRGTRRMKAKAVTGNNADEPNMYNVHVGYWQPSASDVQSYSEKGDGKATGYPHGLQVVIINEQYVHSKQPNPFWHGEIPITCYQSLPVPFVARALSETGKLTDVQRGLNLLLNALITNTMMASDPKMFYEEGAFNPIDWRRGPGAMIKTSKGALSQKQIEWFQPTGTDRGSYNLLKDLEYYGKEDVAGVTAALQGQELSAGSSGAYANTLQGASMTGPMFRIQQLDSGHHRFGEHQVSCYQQFVDFTEPYYIEKHDMDKYHPYMAEAVRDLYYNVEYESQAELPHNPIARHNLYFNQYSEGIIDLEEYVTRAHVSMRPALREKIRDISEKHFMPGIPREVRVQMLLAEAQAAAALAAQQGAGGGGGAPSSPAGNTPPEGLSDEGIAGDPNQRSL